VIPQYPAVSFGVHLHSTATNWRNKLEAAVEAGCVRFDGALKGIGGCPMAQDELVGNMTTEYMVDYFKEKAMPLSINETALTRSLQMASGIFI
jgi:hydroxymethylglutaryl-CoA lyase